MLSRIFEPPNYLTPPQEDGREKYSGENDDRRKGVDRRIAVEIPANEKRKNVDRRKEDRRKSVTVTSVEEITAFAAKKERKLETHVSIIWRYGTRDKTEQLERDNQDNPLGEIRPTFRLFKHYLEIDKQAQPCKDCDEYHYKFLRSKVEEKLSTPNRPAFFPDTYPKQEPVVEYDKKTKITYIKYHCPFMGYITLLFPIVIEKQFLGAVFVGQLLLEGDKDAEKIFDAFLESCNNTSASGNKSPQFASKYTPERTKVFRPESLDHHFK